MVGNRQKEPHTFVVTAQLADEVESVARDVLCDVQFLKVLVAGIRRANLQGLTDPDSPAPAAFLAREACPDTLYSNAAASVALQAAVLAPGAFANGISTI